MSAEQRNWQLVTQYDQSSYKCELRAGDRLVLIKTLRVRDWKGRPTGKYYRRGGVWTVLKGSSDTPGIVFLRQPNGNLHTWDDNDSIWEYFEKVAPRPAMS